MNKIIRISFSGLLFIVLGLFVLTTGSAKAANLPGCYGADKKITNCDVNGVDQVGNNLSTLDSNGNTLSSLNCYVVSSKAGVSPVVYNQVQCSDLKTSITPAAPAASQDPNIVCANSGGAMAWVVCPVIEAVGHGESLFINMINTQLKTKPVNLTSTTDPVVVKTKAIWTNFRFIGNLVLVIAVLVIVYAEAVGGSIADAYTVQKTLPRILITAILINLSIYLMLGLQDIFNVLGSGISDLILQPFKSGGGGGLINISAGTGALFTAGSVGLGLLSVAALTSGIIPILLLLALSGLLALAGVFITVIIRQGILFLLVVTSPVAFALYCLPNTEQYFKKWWNFSIKLLMVYPIVNVVIALAYVSGFVMSQINGGTGGQLLAAIASTLPLFLIPFAFKMSGGAMASIYGAVSGVTNRLRKPINKLAGNIAKKKTAENFNNARAGKYFKNTDQPENSRRGTWNKRLQRASHINKAGLSPSGWSEGIDIAVQNTNKKNSNMEELIKKHPELADLMGNGDIAELARTSQSQEELEAKLTKYALDQKESAEKKRLIEEEGMDEIAAAKQAKTYRQSIEGDATQMSQIKNESSLRARRFAIAKKNIGAIAFDKAMAQAYFSDKNASRNVEEIEKVLADMGSKLGNDSAAKESYIMEVSAMLEKCGRLDFSSASAGLKLAESMKVISAAQNGDPNLSLIISQAAEKIRQSALDGTSGSKAILQAAPRALEQLADQQNRNIEVLKQKMDDDTIDPAEMANLQREYKRQMAAIAANYDTLASGDPAHAKIYADKVMGRSATNTLHRLPKNLQPRRQKTNPNGTAVVDSYGNAVYEDVEVNNQQMIDILRNDPEFLQFRREFSSRQEAERGAPIPPPES
jgi:hypothetical protein